MREPCVKGLNEVCKCLDRKQAILCILAEDCNDPKYKKLVDALAKASNVPLIEVEKRDDLGEWLGHCKYDADGAPKKVKGTSSIAIKNYGEETEALTFVLNYIKEKGLGNAEDARGRQPRQSPLPLAARPLSLLCRSRPDAAPSR